MVTCNPAPKAGKTLSPETTKLVNEFYMSEEISRNMPGMKDFVSVIDGGVRVHKQKTYNKLQLNFTMFEGLNIKQKTVIHSK